MPEIRISNTLRIFLQLLIHTYFIPFPQKECLSFSMVWNKDLCFYKSGLPREMRIISKSKITMEGISIHPSCMKTSSLLFPDLPGRLNFYGRHFLHLSFGISQSFGFLPPPLPHTSLLLVSFVEASRHWRISYLDFFSVLCTPQIM